MPRPQEPIVIRKYPDRQLYHAATSTSATLEDVAGMVRQGADFIVYDTRSSEDITRSVLTQIVPTIVER